MLRAERPEEVPALLAAVEAARRWAVGFVAYEAASGLDRALRTHPLPAGVPAAWFALFDEPHRADDPVNDRALRLVVDPAPALPTIGDEEYRATIAEIRATIARGDTYQANFTYRLRGALAAENGRGAAGELFARLCRVERAPYAALLELGGDLSAGGPSVCSVSPELFFRREHGRLVCRPMKGTAPRGRTVAEDRRMRSALRASTKERAENLMIVDMVRNDLGRVARPGSVRVPALFDVERYDTVHQMTSTVVAESDAPLAELFAALFPCASVTGAPKVRTMEILTDLESTPRGVYTGAVGWVAPEGTARFSVAIRTAWLTQDAAGEVAMEYGTGGGVVWDSDPERELAETRTKAIALRRALAVEPDSESVTGRDFELLETLLWTRAGGWALLDRHLGRLAESAEYFGFRLDRLGPARIRRALDVVLRDESGALRVRLLCDREGGVRTDAHPLGAAVDGPYDLLGPAPDGGAGPVRVALAPEPVDSSDRFLFHKTTRRGVYERALESARRLAASAFPGRPPIDDCLLRNERGELTESTIANLVLELDGELVTPPVECGLLAGTLRAELLARGIVRERVVLPRDLERAAAVYVVNSVRGWRRVEVLLL